MYRSTFKRDVFLWRPWMVVVDPIQRRSRIDVDADALSGRWHFWWPMFSADVLACHLNHDAVDSCVWLVNFWCDIVDGRIRIRTVCRIVRACPESVVSMNSNRKMCVYSMDILVVRWYRHWWAVAFVVVLATTMTSTMTMRTTMMLVQSCFVVLHGCVCRVFLLERKRKNRNKRQNNTILVQKFWSF